MANAARTTCKLTVVLVARPPLLALGRLQQYREANEPGTNFIPYRHIGDARLIRGSVFASRFVQRSIPGAPCQLKMPSLAPCICCFWGGWMMDGRGTGCACVRACLVLAAPPPFAAQATKKKPRRRACNADRRERPLKENSFSRLDHPVALLQPANHGVPASHRCGAAAQATHSAVCCSPPP